MPNADDNQPLSKKALASIKAWLDKRQGDPDGGVFNHTYLLATYTGVISEVVCGAWALDRHGETRHCERDAPHTGPHTNRAYAYHMAWLGIGTDAVEVEDLQGKAER